MEKSLVEFKSEQNGRGWKAVACIFEKRQYHIDCHLKRCVFIDVLETIENLKAVYESCIKDMTSDNTFKGKYHQMPSHVMLVNEVATPPMVMLSATSFELTSAQVMREGSFRYE